MKIWISETEFIDTDDRESMSAEVAVRSRSLDWMGVFGFLPDPDEVLKKLGQDVTVYRQLLVDAHVWSCYQSRVSGVLSKKWAVVEPAEGGSARANKNAYKAINDWIKEIDVRQVITEMLDAVFFGMSPIEIVWGQGPTRWFPERVVGKPVEWFVFDPENNLRFLSHENMTEGEEIPDYKFLLPRHHATYQNPYGERALSRCFWPVVFKKGGFKFWAIFTEKFGMPFITGKVPRMTNDTERAALLSRLTSMVQDAVAVINNDESIEVFEASGKKASADIYEKLVNTSNKEISKALLGQTATTEGTPGKLGNEEAQEKVREDLIDGDAHMVCSAWNLLLKWITEFNFAGAAAPVFEFVEEEDVQKEKAERDETLSRTGVEFTKNYYQRVYNLEEDDFEINKLPQINADTHRFAERVLSPFDAEQNELEDLADTSMDAVKKAMERIDKPIRQMIENAESLEALRDNLFSLYKGMDDGDLEELIRDAMGTAALHGAVSIED